MLPQFLRGAPTGLGIAPRSWKEWLFATALLISSLAVFVPFDPQMPWDGLDPSWKFGMNQAIAQGLVLGKDIIFTFGPYASIYTKTFHPATDHLMIWGSFYLAISFSVAAFLNFREHKKFLGVGLLVVLSTIIYSRDALFFFYPLMVGVYLFKATNSEPAPPSNRARFQVLLIFLFAPLGLFPLIKGSLLIACVAVIILSALLLIRIRRWKLALLIGITGW